jgi:hypothetical protein
MRRTRSCLPGTRALTRCARMLNEYKRAIGQPFADVRGHLQRNLQELDTICVSNPDGDYSLPTNSNGGGGIITTTAYVLPRDALGSGL